MSRYTIANDKFSIAYGVDHVFGGFFQIWRSQPSQPAEDIPLVDVDSHGVRLGWSEDDPDTGEVLEAKLHALLGSNCWTKVLELKRRFAQARLMGNLRPNIHAGDVIDTIRPLGFSDEQHQQIYRAFD